MKIARQGFRYIGILVVLGALVAAVAPSPLFSIPFFVLAAFVTYFFRDPERIPPPDEKLLVSPGDGTRRSIFLNPETAYGVPNYWIAKPYLMLILICNKIN